MIVSADRIRRNQLLDSWSDADVIVAATPLEALRWLELEGLGISTVVLSDVVGSATCAELAEFLDERYPFVRVIFSPYVSDRADGDRRSTTRESHREREAGVRDVVS